VLGNIVTTAIGTAGAVATSVWGQRQPDMMTPVSPYGIGGGYAPQGSTLGSIDSKILLVAAVGVVAILAFSKSKGS
jgi:hypothetical protein